MLLVGISSAAFRSSVFIPFGYNWRTSMFYFVPSSDWWQNIQIYFYCCNEVYRQTQVRVCAALSLNGLSLQIKRMCIIDFTSRWMCLAKWSVRLFKLSIRRVWTQSKACFQDMRDRLNKPSNSIYTHIFFYVLTSIDCKSLCCSRVWLRNVFFL